MIDKAKAVSQGRSWSSGVIFNAVLVAAGIGCGVGALIVKDEETKRGLLTGAAFLYGGQLLESFCSSHFGFLRN